MPRNAQGIYTLPAGNPVVPGTLIESTWANPTMSDIAAALTGSLPRNGSAPMQGPLILAGNAAVPLEAVPLQQLNAIVGGSNTYLPAGAIQLFAMSAIPSGWLECNGAAISRTTYANLFAAIGTVYGAGNGTTTFNLPDLRGEFVRGWDNGRSIDPGRGFGSQQAAANNPHTHTPTVSNPAHSHALTDPGHNHVLTDPGHIHTFPVGVVQGPEAGGTAETNVGTGNTNSAQTGISIAAAVTGISSAAGIQNTSVSIASEGVEARPRNVAMVYAIKAFGALQTDGLGSMAFQNKDAVDITGGSGVFTTLQCTTTPTQPNDVARLADIGGSLSAVLSADPQMLLVDNTNPATPILRPQSNVPFGMVKLDAAGTVPANVLNVTDLTFIGNWDASPGLLPVGVFATGDYYIIDVAGTLTLYTSGGNVSQAVNAGDQIIYNAATPGWWYYPAVVPTSLAATSITFAPEGTIGATNVQAAIAELDGETQTSLAGKAPSSAATAAGTSFTPAGTIGATDVQAAVAELDSETQTALAGKVSFSGGTMTGPLALKGGTAAPAAGMVGELLSNTGGPVDIGVAGAVANIAAVTLTPGVWDVQVYGTFNFSAAGGSLIQVTGSLTPGALGNVSSALLAASFGLGINQQISGNLSRQVVAANTTVTATVRAIGTSGSCQSGATITARRVA